MSDDDEYPSVRRAIFGEEVANIYCACKWALWHLFHVLFVLVGLAMLAILVPTFLVWRVLKAAGLRLLRWTARRLPEPQHDPADPFRLARTGQRLREKPITKRVYGYCPVGIKMDPRWFERVKSAAKRIFEWAEPPSMVWVCAECGDVRHRHGEPTVCFGCSFPEEGGDFERVSETKVEQVHPDAEELL